MENYSELENSIVRKSEILNSKEVRIDNISDYLYTSLNKIANFDFRWSSLITSKPLLFEDIDYVKCISFVQNEILPFEMEAFKTGKLRKIYVNFEYMLMDNLIHYNRIMRFCTLVFLKYIRLPDNSLLTEPFENLSSVISMTPTQIWCCALSNTTSTLFELNYAWGNNINIKLPDNSTNLFQFNWKKFYNNNTFAKFMESCSLCVGTNGFRETYINDKTSNKILSYLCKKFTTTSIALSEDSLSTLYEYVIEEEKTHNKLYVGLYTCMNDMFHNDDNFGIFIFPNEFYLHTIKFSMRVYKSKTGKITKDYLGNNFECFAAEEFLVKSTKMQVEWAKYKISGKYQYDKEILSNLLLNMIQINYKNIICTKKMNEYGISSKISFKGIFNNVYIVEDYYIKGNIIKTNQICLSKKNAAKYVVNRGYYLFGNEKEVLELNLNETLTSKLLIDHYMNYCVSVKHFMDDIIQLYNKQNNLIIDVIAKGEIDESYISKDIKYTTLKGNYKDYTLQQQLLSKALKKQSINLEKKSYWKAISEE
jgi:hypothetical protein